MNPNTRLVETPEGTARLLYSRARRTTTTLVLGHGASGGPDSRDLVALAEGLPAYGITVIRMEQPWRVAGRRVGSPPNVLDRAWVGAIDTLRTRTPLVVGGRSAGARVACRTARSLGALGCVALAFPLHPPSRPEKSRQDELLGAGVPTLVVQGERDTFGTPEEIPEGPDLVVVPGAGHSFQVPKSGPISQPDALVLVVEAVAEWVAQAAVG